MTSPNVLLWSDLGDLPLKARGKFRDIYEVEHEGAAAFVIVTTDRISAFVPKNPFDGSSL